MLQIHVQLELAGTGRTVFVLRLLGCGTTAYQMRSDVQRISKNPHLEAPKCKCLMGQFLKLFLIAMLFSSISLSYAFYVFFCVFNLFFILQIALVI